MHALSNGTTCVNTRIFSRCQTARPRSPDCKRSIKIDPTPKSQQKKCFSKFPPVRLSFLPRAFVCGYLHENPHSLRFYTIILSAVFSQLNSTSEKIGKNRKKNIFTCLFLQKVFLHYVPTPPDLKSAKIKFGDVAISKCPFCRPDSTAQYFFPDCPHPTYLSRMSSEKMFSRDLEVTLRQGMLILSNGFFVTS